MTQFSFSFFNDHIGQEKEEKEENYSDSISVIIYSVYCIYNRT